MRFLSWNCNGAFRKKIGHLPPLDVMVILEAENPEKMQIKSDYRIIWRGDNKSKGVGIFYRDSIQMEIHDTYDSRFRYIIPIQITAPVKLILFAIWAMNNTQDRMRRYIGEVFLALSHYNELLRKPCIIAGDFNWNLIWDTSLYYPLYGTLNEVIKLLERHTIKSIFHESNKQKFGKETSPTFYLYRKENRSYHTDYIFASSELLECVNSFSMGSYSKWRKWSDHMPLFVEFDL